MKMVWDQNLGKALCLRLDDQIAKLSDENRIAYESRFDGKWVLRTNTDRSADQMALKYKGLWQVEIFRDVESLLTTRPIFNQKDCTIQRRLKNHAEISKGSAKNHCSPCSTMKLNDI
jgi:hypothetical protein